MRLILPPTPPLQRIWVSITLGANLVNDTAYGWPTMRFSAILALSFLSACGGSSTETSAMDESLAASLEAFANRKIYTRLDPPTLRSIPDTDLEQAILDYVITKLDGRYDEEVDIVAGLSPGVRATYLTWIVEAEVNNGGFNQYYFNSGGEFAVEAVEAFEYFAAPELAALMKEANAVRASEAAEMAKFKQRGTLEAFSESYDHTNLGPLDDRFYKLAEKLSQLRIARIRQAPEQFSGE